MFGVLGTTMLYIVYFNDIERVKRQNLVAQVWLQFELIMHAVDTWLYVMVLLCQFNFSKDIIGFNPDVDDEYKKEEHDKDEANNEDSFELDGSELETALNKSGTINRWPTLVKRTSSQIYERVKNIRERMADKTRLRFMKEDIIIMTSLCFLKENVRKYEILAPKRSQLLWSAIAGNAITFFMLYCMYRSMTWNEGGLYTPNIAQHFTLFFVKFPCALALHFFLYPEVADSLTLMKFAVNEPQQFVNSGSEIAFILGFVRCCNAIFCEGINIFMLSFQNTVQYCIIHFVALEVIMEVTKLYFESMHE